MTAPVEQHKERTAAMLFAGFLTLAMGGAGLLVAALAVGIERAWNGGEVEADRARERRRGWLEERRAWLDVDHAQQTARAADRRNWLTAGGDPAKEPAAPTWTARFRDGIRRAVAHTAIAVSDFANGAREGWNAANETRKSGGGFRDIALTRPEQAQTCATCKRPGIPITDSGLCGDCLAVYQPDEPRPAAPAETRSEVCRNCRRPMPVGYSGICTDCEQPTAGSAPIPPAASAPIPQRASGEDHAPKPATRPVEEDHTDDTTNPNWEQERRWIAEAGQRLAHNLGNDCGNPDCRACGDEHRRGTYREAVLAAHATHSIGCPTCGAPTDRNRYFFGAQPGTEVQLHCPRCGWLDPMDANSPVTRVPANQQPPTSIEGDTMTETAAAASGTMSAESNATVLRGLLMSIQSTLGVVSDQTDQLATTRTQLSGEVARAEEFATVTGQSAQARQALDEAKAVATAMGKHLGDFSQGAVSAEDQMGQASNGLRVAEEAEDSLRSAGADGRAVAPAGAHA